MAKRTLILFSDVLHNGGIQRFNRTLLSACEKLGSSCDVISLADDEAAARNASLAPPLNMQGCGGSKLVFVRAAARALRSGNYDTMIIGHIHLLVAIVALRTLLRSRARMILIAHGTEVWRGVRRLDRIALRAVTRILCVSRYTRDQLIGYAAGVAPSRFALFPNALSEDWIRKHSQRTSSRQQRLPPTYILSVARLTRHDRTKGITSVIEAMRTIPVHVHYVIAGQGDDAGYLRDWARRLGVADRVHMLGAVPDSELAQLYENCAAFVLPSSQEGFGIVFLEAMYFGAPVIASNEKGATDVVQDEETGLLVRYGDSSAIGRAIERVLAEPQLAARLRGRGRALVTDNGKFAFTSFVARTASIIGVVHGSTSEQRAV